MNWILLPPWGVRAVALVGAALVAVTLYRMWRERRSAQLGRQAPALALRAAAIVALLAVALNPTGLVPREVEGKSSLVVLVDTSASMATPDEDGRPRLAAALETLQGRETLERLQRSFSLDFRTFDRTDRPALVSTLSGARAEGTGSDLASALASAVDDVAERPQPAGVVLASDGRATTEGALEAARLALARGAPLWTWRLGGEVPRRDLWVEVPASEVLAFAGAETELLGALHQVGYENRQFRVEVLKHGEVVTTVDVTPGEDGRAPVRAMITAPESGEHQYVLRAVPDPEEFESANNERSVFLRVVGKQVRVLVAEGQPHWDTKFLVQYLKREPHAEVTALYRLRDNRLFGVISSGGRQERKTGDLFPRTEEAFAAYDVVILGRGCESFFDEKTESLLQQFVARQGGGLVLARGKPYGGRFQALAKFEPIVWGDGIAQDLRLEPTDVGARCPILELATAGDLQQVLDRLPPFDQAAATQGVKPLAVVLAAAQPDASPGADEPPVLMAYHHYGLGRVVALNASGLWRWSFREKGTEEDEFVYDRFWSAMLRWLLAGSEFLAGHDVALQTDRRLYTDEQPVRFLVRTRGLDREAYRPHLSVTGADGAAVAEVDPRSDPTGAWIAEAGPLAPGLYTVRLSGNMGNPPELTTAVQVVSSSIENRILSADPELMSRLAEVSEGRAIEAGDVARLDEIVRQWRVRRHLADEKVALWDHWAVLAAVLAVLAAEWFMRRREGLL